MVRGRPNMVGMNWNWNILQGDLTSMPGLRFNPMMLLHGEQELVLPAGRICRFHVL
jgi:hypothetical protein